LNTSVTLLHSISCSYFVKSSTLKEIMLLGKKKIGDELYGDELEVTAKSSRCVPYYTVGKLSSF